MKKRFLTLFYVAVLLVVFLVPASAASTISLKQLIEPVDDPDGERTEFYVGWNTNQYYAKHSWTGENLLTIQNGQDGFSEGFNNATIISIFSGRYPVQAGDILYWNAGYWVTTPMNTASYDADDFLLDISINTIGKDGVGRWVKVFDGTADYVWKDSSQRVGFYFDIKYVFPTNVESLNGIKLEFSFPTTISTAFNLQCDADKMIFYVGNSENAPMYGSADTTNVDESHAMEQEILDRTEQGRDDTIKLFDDGISFFESGAGMLQGALVLTSIIDRVANSLGINQVLMISLCLGLFAFIIGASTFVHVASKPSSSVKKSGKKGS